LVAPLVGLFNPAAGFAVPIQTGNTGFGNEPDFVSPVLHFPMLRGVVEFEVASPGDLEPAQFM